MPFLTFFSFLWSPSIVCGFRTKPLAQIFAESSSLPAPDPVVVMPASPKVFSPVLFLPPSETAGFSRKRQIRRVWFPAAGRLLSTSKQRDSPLSYALHFLRQNIPPNVLRSGKAARKESSLRLPWEKCKKSTEKNARAAKRLKRQRKKMQNISGPPNQASAAFITETGGFDRLFILVKRLGPSVASWSCGLELDQIPEPKKHKQLIKVPLYFFFKTAAYPGTFRKF